MGEVELMAAMEGMKERFAGELGGDRVGTDEALHGQTEWWSSLPL